MGWGENDGKEKTGHSVYEDFFLSHAFMRKIKKTAFTAGLEKGTACIVYHAITYTLLATDPYLQVWIYLIPKLSTNDA